MNFLIWHLLAICSVMAISFIAGVWFANNTWIRFKKTSSWIKPAPDSIKLYNPRKNKNLME
ncbi:MAG: hypothetical protein CMA64_09565 [Euryarchaeota archaeon]|nr:hypothetical protein [Euryarchaeota archaeon]